MVLGSYLVYLSMWQGEDSDLDSVQNTSILGGTLAEGQFPTMAEGETLEGIAKSKSRRLLAPDKSIGRLVCGSGAPGPFINLLGRKVFRKRVARREDYS